jgi:ParB family transcriptional regulator, chromosome partitioning protein
MASVVQKVSLTSSRDIPFSKLTLSPSNVRRIPTGVSIEELAEDIVRRTLLQSLSVRPVLDGEGKETGIFEVQAGGRRYRALELLVKQKRMSKTQLVPCIVRNDGLAEEDSLAENVQRVSLHPLDQFRAFQTLREKGLSEEDIAARFFVSVTVVKQRLKLASVSPKLLDIYSADSISLEQLMAFTVTNDHARQEEVWDAVKDSWNKNAQQIRRMLTERTVEASDKRAVFVGVGAYEKAGGTVIRDLFAKDHGSYLEDVALLDRLVADKLKAEAETIAKEGWKWIVVDVEIPFGHTHRLRRIPGKQLPLTDEQQAAIDALEAEHTKLEDEYQDADEVPEKVEARLQEIEVALAAFENRPEIYDPADVARAGVFVGLGYGGALSVKRGYVRPEDEPAAVPAPTVGRHVAGRDDESDTAPADVPAVQHTVITIGQPQDEPDDGVLKPLSERLIGELTAFRTLALRDAVANNPHVAITALLHKLCIDVFRRHGSDSCLEASVREVNFSIQPSDLGESAPAKAVEARHAAWEKELPKSAMALWDWLDTLNEARRSALLAHCVSLGVNALYEKSGYGSDGIQRRIAHADQLARAVRLDPVAAGWQPTADNYLGRVSKVRIIEAVREVKGDKAVQLIDNLKKADMAKEAERLLADTGWLPEPLRTPEEQAEEAECEFDAEDLPAFLEEEDDEESHEIAAE